MKIEKTSLGVLRLSYDLPKEYNMRGECGVYLFMIIVRTFQFEQSQSVTGPDVKIARRYKEED